MSWNPGLTELSQIFLSREHLGSVVSLQTYVESVYLNNEEVLRLQTNENHDIFHWLKLQARNGAADAEVNLTPRLHVHHVFILFSIINKQIVFSNVQM